MKNKNGFTLIEVIVSIVLVSVVMVSLLGSLIQLRQTYTVIHEDSDIIVYSSSISRVINNDLTLNNGIRYCTCDADGNECNIILGNDSRRKLEIKKNTKCFQGNDGTECAQDHNKEIIRTTLQYTDNTKEKDPKLLYIRTLEMTRKETKGSVNATGYGFSDLSTTVYEHDNPDEDGSLIDQYTTILVRLNDEVNEDINKHDIILYTSGRYNYSNLIGKTYELALNTNGAEMAETTMITEVFGVGYFETEANRTVGNQYTAKSENRKKLIPVNGEKAFLGYYYSPPGSSQKIQVIDSKGGIVTSSRFFREDVDYNTENNQNKAVILAEWGDCTDGYRIIDGICTPIEYTVTLNKNGGTGGTSSYTVAYMSSVPDISIPHKKGYQFAGYYDSGIPYHDKYGNGTFVYNIKRDSTATAQYSECTNNAHVAEWEDNDDCKIVSCQTGYSVSGNACVGNTYVAKFEKNGATSISNTQLQCTVDNDEGNCKITAPTIKRDGFTIKGWNIDQNASTGETTLTLDRSRTYYAITVKDITISFTANGNTLDATSRSCSIKNSASTCEITSPTITPPSGFSVIGYSTGATTYSSSWGSNAKKNVDKNATYYAQSKKAGTTYTVTYNKGSNVSSIGTGSGCTTTAGYNGTQPGSSCNVTLPSITANTGYTSVGWSTTNGATTGTAVGASYSINKNTTLYANAKANTYTISFNCNGGSGAPGSITVTYGKKVSGFPSTVCKKKTSMQSGWYENTSGSGTNWTSSYASNYVWNRTSNLTLYAKWSYSDICSKTGTLFGWTCDQYSLNWKSGQYYTYWAQCEGLGYKQYWHQIYCGNPTECAKYGYTAGVTTVEQMKNDHGCADWGGQWCTCPYL